VRFVRGVELTASRVIFVLTVGGTMDENDYEIAVGEAAQDAVWTTQHPLTHHIAEDDPRRVQYLREYQKSVGSQVLAAIKTLGR
jgi:hypothetical protein